MGGRGDVRLGVGGREMDRSEERALCYRAHRAWRDWATLARLSTPPSCRHEGG